LALRPATPARTSRQPSLHQPQPFGVSYKGLRLPFSLSQRL
jgi:hypothetical protein